MEIVEAGERLTGRVADLLRDHVRGMWETVDQAAEADSPELFRRLVSDLVGGALSDVDWFALADHFIADAADQ